MEVQLTDFENAAFAIFLVLLTRAILSFGLNFYMPISKVTPLVLNCLMCDWLTRERGYIQVDENMQRAHRRNAAREGRFFFRKNVFQYSGRAKSFTPDCRCSSANNSNLDSPQRTRDSSPELGPVEDEYVEMTIDEIINGRHETLGDNGAADSPFPGLLGLVRSYVSSLNVDLETQCYLDRYLDLVRRRANGELFLCTLSGWYEK
jgi:glutamate--cysteine ligase catalytic subunit